MSTRSEIESDIVVDDKPSLETLNTSSEINRNLGLTFVAFLILLLSLTNSITDLNLLKNDQIIKLPILDIEINLISFAFIAPFLLLFFHINLFINLSEHASKLYSYIGPQKRKTGLNIIERNLHPFIFNYTIFRTNRFHILLSQILSFSVMVILPMITLYYLQKRFLDLHDLNLTVLQSIVVFTDFSLCIYFSVEIYKYFRSPTLKSFSIYGNKYSRTLVFLNRVFHFIQKIWYYKIEIIGFFLIAIIVLLTAFNFRIIQLITNEYQYKQVSYLFDTYNFEKTRARDQLAIDKRSVNWQNIGNTIIGSEAHDTIPNSFLGWLIPEPNLSFDREDIYKDRPSEDALIALDKRDSMRIASTIGINLESRDLKYAKFIGCKLNNALLNNTNMQFSNWEKAQLQGVNIQDANFTLAALRYVNLSKGAIQRVKLDSSMLEGAIMKQVSLEEDSLKDCVFKFSYMQGINVFLCKLLRANLNLTHLEGSEFYHCNFNGANFRHSKLQGSDLIESEFEDVKFNNANLEGSKLDQVSFQGSIFTKANLPNIEIWDCNFSGCTFISSYIKNISIYNTNVFSHAILLKNYRNKMGPPRPIKWTAKLIPDSTKRQDYISRMRSTECLDNFPDTSYFNADSCAFYRTRYHNPYQQWNDYLLDTTEIRSGKYANFNIKIYNRLKLTSPKLVKEINKAFNLDPKGFKTLYKFTIVNDIPVITK